jgi:hypothetical protein
MAFAGGSALMCILAFWSVMNEFTSLPFKQIQGPAPLAEALALPPVKLWLGNELLPSHVAAPAKYAKNDLTEQKIFFMSQKNLKAVCGKGVIACADVGGPDVVMPDPCIYKFDPYAVTLCHELGHNKGWNAEHSN